MKWVSLRRGFAAVLLAAVVIVDGASAFAADITLWPVAPRPTGTLADALDALKSGKLAEADALFQRLLANDPNLALAALGRAQIAVAARNLDVADRAVTAVLSRQPSLPEAHNMKGVVLLLQKKTAAARGEFNKAIEFAPQYVTPRLYLASLSRAEGNHRQAAADYQSLAKVAPRLPAAYIGQAEAHMLMDNPTAAFGALNAWKAADPRNLLPSRVIATVHLARGSAPLAIQELQGALKVDPKDAETLSALGGAYLAAGNRQAASTQFAAALALDPKNVTAAMGQAELAVASGNTERALAAFRAVLAIDPAHAVAQNNVAWLLANQGTHLDEALRIASAVATREPGYVDAHDTLGWVHYRRAEYARAAAAFKAAKALAPARPDIAAHLGMAYAKIGQKKEALSELKRALAPGNDLPNRAELEGLVKTLSLAP